LAADIENEFGVKPQLIPSSGGVYKITADETVLYSKKDSNDQFPKEGVVIEEIKAYRSTNAES
jgi:predicted Rdx family selenoprotein